jgi:uncharacterized membrane protein
MGCIYRIICWATGQSYVGQTSYSNPFVRFLQHQTSAKKGVEGALYDAMRLYDIHEFECVCICVVPNTALNELECYYAEQYDAYYWDGGFNYSECGNAKVRREMTDEKRKWVRQKAIWKNRYKK